MMPSDSSERIYILQRFSCMTFFQSNNVVGALFTVSFTELHNQEVPREIDPSINRKSLAIYGQRMVNTIPSYGMSSNTVLSLLSTIRYFLVSIWMFVVFCVHKLIDVVSAWQVGLGALSCTIGLLTWLLMGQSVNLAASSSH